MTRGEIRTLVRQYCPKLIEDREIENAVRLAEKSPLINCDYRVAQSVSDYLNKKCRNGNPLIGIVSWAPDLAELTRRVEFMLDCCVLDVNAFIHKN